MGRLKWPTLYICNINLAIELECITLEQSTYHISHFDGKNLPLKDFLQDV